jgi:hypothetical protein
MNPAIRPKMIQPMMDIGCLQFGKFSGASLPAPASPLPTKCDDKSKRHRKHHTCLKQVLTAQGIVPQGHSSSNLQPEFSLITLTMLVSSENIDKNQNRDGPSVTFRSLAP